jgi:hypothetical protein
MPTWKHKKDTVDKAFYTIDIANLNPRFSSSFTEAHLSYVQYCVKNNTRLTSIKNTLSISNFPLLQPKLSRPSAPVFLTCLK